MQLKLMDLNEQLKESLAKTSAIKAQIAKNDDRIEQILNLVVQI